MTGLTSTDVQTAYDLFWKNLSYFFDIYFPLVSKKVNRNKHKVEKWMTKGLIISRNIKNKLRLKSLKFPTLTYIKEYKQYRNLYNCLIRKAKEMHFNQ